MVKTEAKKIVVYFERPEKWRGELRVPAGFDEMDYDEQNDIIQLAMDTMLPPPVIDYWDYDVRG